MKGCGNRPSVSSAHFSRKTRLNTSGLWRTNVRLKLFTTTTSASLLRCARKMELYSPFLTRPCKRRLVVVSVMWKGGRRRSRPRATLGRLNERESLKSHKEGRLKTCCFWKQRVVPLPLLSSKHARAGVGSRREACGFISGASAMSAALLRDAVRIIALAGGADGLPLSSLFQLLQEMAHAFTPDAATKAFVWSELCKHRHVLLQSPRNEDVRAIRVEAAGAVRVSANERLRAWVCGIREGEDKDGFPTFASADMAKVIEDTARGSGTGALQHHVTKSVGIPANKLAYQLSMLEMDYVMRRQAVIVKLPKGGGGAAVVVRSTDADGEGADADDVDTAGSTSAAAGSSLPLGRKGNAGLSMLRTNLLMLPALRQGEAQTTAAPLAQYAKGNGDQDSLLSQMVGMLSRAPYQRLPLVRLRRALHLIGKGEATHTWRRLKAYALATGIIAEARYRVSVGVRADGTPRIGTRHALRLLSQPAVLSSTLTPLLDQPPMQQILNELSSAGTSGVLVSGFSSLQLHPKHITKLTSAVVADFGASSRPEQIGRSRAHRYFAPGLEPGARASTEANAGSSSSASRARLQHGGETLQNAQRRCHDSRPKSHAAQQPGTRSDRLTFLSRA